MVGREETWRQPGLAGMVALSLLLHAAGVSALLLIPHVLGQRTYYAPPVYTVSLVSPTQVRKAKPKSPSPKPRVKSRKRAVKPKMTLAKKKKQRVREERQIKQTIEALRKQVAIRTKPSTKVSPTARMSGVVTRKNLDLRYKAYYNLIWERVREAWVLPESLVRQRLESIIGIRIGRSGVIHLTWMEKASGNRVFDQSARRAVAKVNPLPPLPREFPEEYLEVGLRFTPDDY